MRVANRWTHPIDASRLQADDEGHLKLFLYVGGYYIYVYIYKMDTMRWIPLCDGRWIDIYKQDDQVVHLIIHDFSALLATEKREAILLYTLYSQFAPLLSAQSITHGIADWYYYCSGYHRTLALQNVWLVTSLHHCGEGKEAKTTAYT